MVSLSGLSVDGYSGLLGKGPAGFEFVTRISILVFRVKRWIVVESVVDDGLGSSGDDSQCFQDFEISVLTQIVLIPLI